jgi:hypothetical protein
VSYLLLTILFVLSSDRQVQFMYQFIRRLLAMSLTVRYGGEILGLEYTPFQARMSLPRLVHILYRLTFHPRRLSRRVVIA